MSVNILSAAKRMGQHSNWTLSNLKMQKILYLAHMFYMGEHSGEPLVSGYFEAWDLGPVHPGLYHEVKIYGAKPVRNIFHRISDVIDDDIVKYLDYSVDSLSKYTGAELVAITHWKEGAWHLNYRPGIRGIQIPNKDILNEYKCRIQRAEERERGNSE